MSKSHFLEMNVVDSKVCLIVSLLQQEGEVFRILEKENDKTCTSHFFIFKICIQLSHSALIQSDLQDAAWT